mgnify:FL=1|tara:strand:+ start:1437 stop:2411 length:975 start_codon:yes stop_codon:yes gene_type:complete
MRYKITVYPQVLEPWSGHEYTITLQGLTSFLTKKRAKVDKKKMVAWTPSIFTDTYRKSENCKAVFLMVFDVDNQGLTKSAKERQTTYYGTETDNTFEQVHATLKVMGLTHIMHTSYSSTKTHNKFRVIMPLEKPVDPSKWTNVYKAGVEWFKDLFWDDIIDSSTCDSARAYFTAYHTDSFMSAYFEGDLVDFEAKGDARAEKIRIEREKARAKNEAELKRREAHNKTLKGKDRAYSDHRKYMYALLNFDYNARCSLASKLGCKIRGNRAEGFTCPACRRSDATFFYVEPYVASSLFCGHVKSCGDKVKPRSFSAGYVAEFWGLL